MQQRARVSHVCSAAATRTVFAVGGGRRSGTCAGQRAGVRDLSQWNCSWLCSLSLAVIFKSRLRSIKQVDGCMLSVERLLHQCWQRSHRHIASSTFVWRRKRRPKDWLLVRPAGRVQRCNEASWEPGCAETEQVQSSRAFWQAFIVCAEREFSASFQVVADVAFS